MKYSLFVVLVAEAERLNFIAFAVFPAFFLRCILFNGVSGVFPFSPEVRISKRKIIF